MKLPRHPLTGSSNQGVYRAAANLVVDTLAAARVTERAFHHVRDSITRTDTFVTARRTLLKIVLLESAADSLRTTIA